MRPSKPLRSIPPFDNDERSLIGAKTLRRDPCVVLRNLIWLIEKKRIQSKVSVDVIHLLPNLRSALLHICCQSLGAVPKFEEHTWSHSKNVWLKSFCDPT